jgi:hypothetical protein
VLDILRDTGHLTRWAEDPQAIIQALDKHFLSLLHDTEGEIRDYSSATWHA